VGLLKDPEQRIHCTAIGSNSPERIDGKGRTGYVENVKTPSDRISQSHPKLGCPAMVEPLAELNTLHELALLITSSTRWNGTPHPSFEHAT
jgi:hypothetical protein